MRKGLGIDIIEIRRFVPFTKNRTHRFLRDTFTDRELTHCFAFKDPAPHLAGTFAAKEAVFKVLSRGDILLSSIEIRREKGGTPAVFIGNRRRKSILVSISHTAQDAVAAAIII